MTVICWIGLRLISWRRHKTISKRRMRAAQGISALSFVLGGPVILTHLKD